MIHWSARVGDIEEYMKGTAVTIAVRLSAPALLSSKGY